MFNKLREMIDWVFGYLGYFRPNQTIEEKDELIDDLYDELDEYNITLIEKEYEVGGLLAAIVELQKRHNVDNTLLSALMTLSGKDEEILQDEFFKGIYEKNLITVTEIQPDGTIKIKVVIGEQPDESES